MCPSRVSAENRFLFFDQMLGGGGGGGVNNGSLCWGRASEGTTVGCINYTQVSAQVKHACVQFEREGRAEPTAVIRPQPTSIWDY